MREIKREKKDRPAKDESPLYQKAMQFGLEINVAIKEKNIVLYSYKALLFSQLLSTETFSPATLCWNSLSSNLPSWWWRVMHESDILPSVPLSFYTLSNPHSHLT
jgi:hypothetical protein